jgi:hypothetical protein
MTGEWLHGYAWLHVLNAIATPTRSFSIISIVEQYRDNCPMPSTPISARLMTIATWFLHHSPVVMSQGSAGPRNMAALFLAKRRSIAKTAILVLEACVAVKRVNQDP